MSRLGKTFLQGLCALTPLALTVYILYWVVSASERLIGQAMEGLNIPGYFPGLGLLVVVGLIFLCGLSLQLWVIRSLKDSIESLLRRLPLIKTLYGSFKDLFDYFSGEGRQAGMDTVVEVSLPGLDMTLIGFVTNEAIDQGPLTDDSGKIAVYLPMSYQVGGYMVLVDRTRVRRVDMGTEEALRTVFTAAVTGASD